LRPRLSMVAAVISIPSINKWNGVARERHPSERAAIADGIGARTSRTGVRGCATRNMRSARRRACWRRGVNRVRMSVALRYPWSPHLIRGFASNRPLPARGERRRVTAIAVRGRTWSASWHSHRGGHR
jgi:hypothetical protein